MGWGRVGGWEGIGGGSGEGWGLIGGGRGKFVVTSL